MNYPIKFEPILKEKVWGGTKLKELFNKNSTYKNTGESWEISGVPGNISIVAEGPEKGKSLKELISQYKSDFMGNKIYNKYGENFPLLIKFIDAETNLSVQVHPDDESAIQRHNSFGKTEMWYILQAEKGSQLNIGFKESINKEIYLEALENEKILSLLHFEEVKSGDAIFINTGKVHAIGGGIVLAEIQQTSDITYRIYDWDRVDEKGNKRELHTELALDTIDFERKKDYKLNYYRRENQSSRVASCPYFTTNFLLVEKTILKSYDNLDSFVIYICVNGHAIIETQSSEIHLKKGDTILLPAALNKIKIISKFCEILEVYCE